MSRRNMLQNCAIPILPSQNLSETIAFYRKLGFAYVSGDQETYAILCRDTIELHFSLFPEIVPGESYAACYLRVTNVDELFQEFMLQSLPAKGIPRIGHLDDKPWGMREFYVVDPDGNLLKIGQRLN
nr:MAG: VOC family protein [Leptolyngbya sp. IPPAS B-1204]